jgi:hypothetical protein
VVADVELSAFVGSRRGENHPGGEGARHQAFGHRCSRHRFGAVYGRCVWRLKPNSIATASFESGLWREDLPCTF